MRSHHGLWENHLCLKENLVRREENTFRQEENVVRQKEIAARLLEFPIRQLEIVFRLLEIAVRQLEIAVRQLEFSVRQLEFPVRVTEFFICFTEFVVQNARCRVEQERDDLFQNSMPTPEHHLEECFIEKFLRLRYADRGGIRDRATLEEKNDSGNGCTKTILCLLQLFIVSNRDSTYYFANNIARHFAFNAEDRVLPSRFHADRGGLCFA